MKLSRQMIDKLSFGLVHAVVYEHCVANELRLAGFYAFLREITAVQKKLSKAFEGTDLSRVAQFVVMGYWYAVAHFIGDLAYRESKDVIEDSTVLRSIQVELKNLPAILGNLKILRHAQPNKRHTKRALSATYTNTTSLRHSLEIQNTVPTYSTSEQSRIFIFERKENGNYWY